ncbi:hypothetical protein GQ457_18G009750 [Hibiscus cannabinus]
MQLVSAQEADTPSASSFQLNSALFSSTSALLAQLKLNNPKVAETYPAQGRVSYEHVDIMWGVLHQSMHMHSMCCSLGMLWACGRDLGTSQACGWLNQPLSLHLFPPKWCEHTLQMSGPQCIRPKGVGKLKFEFQIQFDECVHLFLLGGCIEGHSFEECVHTICSFQLNDADTPSSSSTQLIKAPISSTSALLAQLKLNNLEVAESVLRQLEAVLHLGGGVLSMCMACGTFTHERAYISPRSVTYEEGSSDDPEERPPSLQTQAIIRELKKSFREELEPIHDRLERLEGSQTNATEEDHAENGSDQTPNQRQNPRQGRVQQVDDNLTNIKERAYISPRSVTYEEGSFRQAISYHLACAKLVSAQEADTPSASSFQLNSAQFNSTSALLAQLKLNNPEVAETYPAQGRVSYEHVGSPTPIHAHAQHVWQPWHALGRPWQYDKRVLHDCFTNRYSFTHEGRRVILTPLTLSQVSEDHVRMKASIEAWEASKSKKACEEEKAKSKELSDYTFSSTSSNLQEKKEMPYEIPKVFSGRNLDCDIRFSPLHTNLIAYPWIYNVRRALSVYMLFIIRKGTRMKTCLALSDFVFPVGSVVPRERTCAHGLKLSSVEAWELVCSSFQLHEADTLQLAHFSSTQLNFSSGSSTQVEQPSGS